MDASVEKMNELCFLLQEKNELITRYHAARFLLHRRKQYKNDASFFRTMGPHQEGLQKRINAATKYYKLNKHDQKVYMLEAHVELESVRLAILKWTSANRKRVAALSKELGVRVASNSHSRYYNFISNQYRFSKDKQPQWKEVKQGELIQIDLQEINRRAEAWVFEQVVLKAV